MALWECRWVDTFWRPGSLRVKESGLQPTYFKEEVWLGLMKLERLLKRSGIKRHVWLNVEAGVKKLLITV